MRRRLTIPILVAVVVAAGALWAWTRVDDEDPRRPEPWHREEVVALDVTADRSEAWIRGPEYRSASCYDSEGRVERSGDTWTVSLWVRRNGAEFCTTEGCITEDRTRLEAVEGQRPVCDVTVVPLDPPPGADVEVVPAT